MQHELIVRNSTELYRFSALEIAAMLADGNYCTVILTDGTRELLPCKLKHMEELCNDQLGAYKGNFVRIGRSAMINQEYIYNINIPERRIVMRSFSGSKLRLDHLPPEALKALKMFVERNIEPTQTDGKEEED